MIGVLAQSEEVPPPWRCYRAGSAGKRGRNHNRLLRLSPVPDCGGPGLREVFLSEVQPGGGDSGILRHLWRRPSGLCLPANAAPTIRSFPNKFVQTPSLIVVIYEADVPGLRQIFLDGRAHLNDGNPT